MKKYLVNLTTLVLLVAILVNCQKQEEILPDKGEGYIRAKVEGELFTTNDIIGIAYGISREKPDSIVFLYHLAGEDRNGNVLYFGVDDFVYKGYRGQDSYAIHSHNFIADFENPKAFFFYGKESGAYTYEQPNDTPSGHYRVERQNREYVYGTFAFNLVDKKRNKTLSITEGEFKIKKTARPERLYK
ncbi:MAG: hypothetical protein NZ551_11065 [Microscillaceae bacterium]|nr:hypothetical protein [Microscillaceae bacterium]MDW8461737.1 hypothetical protein [Cytophagales bacterium]